MLGLCVALHHDNKARNTVKVQCPLFAFLDSQLAAIGMKDVVARRVRALEDEER